MLTLMPSAVSTSTAGVPSISGGHLDHDVRPRYHLPEMPSLGDGCSGVVGGAWRDFEADEPVCTVAMVVHGSKNISRQLNVLDDQTFGERSVVDVAISIQRPTYSGIVIRATSNRLGENGRVAGHAAQTILFDQSL